MNDDTNLLSPNTSPDKLHASGVKRVNNLPLILVISVLAIFALLIAYVAEKRASAQNQVSEVVKLNKPRKNMMSLANKLFENHEQETSFQPSNSLPIKAELPKESSNLSKSVNYPDIEPDSEVERIRQAKTQSFEEAVKAKTSISIESSTLRATPSDSKANNLMYKHSRLSRDERAKIQSPLSIGGNENATRWRLNSQLENPSSKYELRAGGVLPGVMISGISSELPGQIIGQVSQNVYDTATGKYLLIPQGTKLIGVYSNDVGYGQNSVLVAWQRLVFPDGKALDLGSMPGADSAGYGGFRDQVNHHYMRTFGSALLMSAIVAGVTYSQSANQTSQTALSQPTAGNVLSQALGQQLGEVASQMVAKNLNLAPTIHIRPGYRFNVIVVKDLTFQRPYTQFTYQ